MGRTRAEQETVIRWDEDEQIVHVWSASPKTWRKLAKLGVAPHKTTTLGGQPSGKFYRLPLAEFRWRLKARRTAAGPANSGRFAKGQHPPVVPETPLPGHRAGSA